MNERFDLVVGGGGIHGCTAALFAARGGMSVALVERGALCREASGVNAGTLTLQMTRVALDSLCDACSCDVGRRAQLARP